MKKYFVLIGLASLILNCHPKLDKRKNFRSQLMQVEWLLGTWENKTPKGSIFETWVKRSESEFLGKSYKLKEKDTLVFESIQLLQKNDSLFYIPTVKNQNQGKAVIFKLINMANHQLIFENPTHDFPQKITYTLIKSDSSVAEISGKINGAERSQRYPMRKISN